MNRAYHLRKTGEGSAELYTRDLISYPKMPLDIMDRDWEDGRRFLVSSRFDLEQIAQLRL